jgi:hypothetical protein
MKKGLREPFWHRPGGSPRPTREKTRRGMPPLSFSPLTGGAHQSSLPQPPPYFSGMNSPTTPLPAARPEPQRPSETPL